MNRFPNECKMTLLSFYKHYVEPNLLSCENMSKAHNEVMQCLTTPPYYFVRRFGEYQKRGSLYEMSRLKFYSTDNEPTAYIYSFFCNNGNNDLKLKEMIEKKNITCGWSIEADKQDQQKWNVKGSGDINEIRKEYRLKLCHIFNAAEGISSEINHENMKMRMIRNLHPVNIFPFPTPYNVKRGGYFKNNDDLGEKRKIQAWIWKKINKKYKEIAKEFYNIANPQNNDLHETEEDTYIIDFKWSPPADKKVANKIISMKPLVKNVSYYEDISGIYICRNQIIKAKETLNGDIKGYETRNIDIGTNKHGYIFVIEKPGINRKKINDILKEVDNNDKLVFANISRTGNQSKIQYYTQFGCCYIVKKEPKKNRTNFIPYSIVW